MEKLIKRLSDVETKFVIDFANAELKQIPWMDMNTIRGLTLSYFVKVLKKKKDKMKPEFKTLAESILLKSEFTIEKDILTIIEDAFDDQISVEGWLDFGTPMAILNGKEFFIKQIETELKELLK